MASRLLTRYSYFRTIRTKSCSSFFSLKLLSTRSFFSSAYLVRILAGEHSPSQHTYLSQKYRYNSTYQPPLETSFPDPSRGDLFYHLVHAPTPVSENLPAFAVSFLPDSPSDPNSSTIIGWLPGQTHRPTDVEDSEQNGRLTEEEAGLHDFKENARFLDVLHEGIKGGLRDGVDEIWVNGALQIQQGWMHIHDQRNIPALGRIGDPDDIIASVLVEDSKILPETYQPMPSYRICTADGVLQLTPGLATRLREALVRIAATEIATVKP